MFRFGVEKAKTACYDTLKGTFPGAVRDGGEHRGNRDAGGLFQPQQIFGGFSVGDEPHTVGLSEIDHILSINCLDKKTIFRYDFS